MEYDTPLSVEEIAELAVHLEIINDYLQDRSTTYLRFEYETVTMENDLAGYVLQTLIARFLHQSGQGVACSS